MKKLFVILLATLILIKPIMFNNNDKDILYAGGDDDREDLIELFSDDDREDLIELFSNGDRDDDLIDLFSIMLIV